VALTRTPIVASVLAFARRLRFPTLFFLFAGLLVVDLVVPDVVPYVDEVLLALGTLLLSRWRKQRSGEGP
jgi:hypothetical protein